MGISTSDGHLAGRNVKAYRRALGLSLALITVFGLITKFYPGPGHSWLNNAFGGVPYEIFWILLVALIWPSLSPAAIAVGVLLATGLLEVAQLWKPGWLQAIRATLPGRLVLGNTFSWADFPYYGVGCGLGWLWLRWLARRSAGR
ncbi:MAG: DUF2809 domain-containing protein [Nodosilinea sp.]